jgi:hypothetical protein
LKEGDAREGVAFFCATCRSCGTLRSFDFQGQDQKIAASGSSYMTELERGFV